MVQSAAKSVDAYINELPENRRALITAVRKLIQKNLPRGYEEAIGWGVITYNVPLSRLADTYNGQPLCYVGLASQKHYCSLYLMTVYGDPVREREFKRAFSAAGKKLNMGKSCVRFKRLDDLALDAIAEVIAATPLERYVKLYQKSRQRMAAEKQKKVPARKRAR